MARTGVSGLRRRECSGCRNGGTPAMFKVMVKRSNGQMVILDKKSTPDKDVGCAFLEVMV